MNRRAFFGLFLGAVVPEASAAAGRRARIRRLLAVKGVDFASLRRAGPDSIQQVGLQTLSHGSEGIERRLPNVENVWRGLGELPRELILKVAHHPSDDQKGLGVAAHHRADDADRDGFQGHQPSQDAGDKIILGVSRVCHLASSPSSAAGGSSPGSAVNPSKI